MKRKFLPLCGIGLVAALSGAAAAQRSPPPAGVISAPAATVAAPDPATIPLPDLTFEPTPEIEENYGKYHFFHREGADYATAYADILECDGYSRGFTNTAGGGDAAVPYPYAGTVAGALGGAIGGAIGNSIADAIWGSQERRRLRRVNMRTCMAFKGYRAYGLPERLWDEFNFTEGRTTVEPGRRARMLQVQARVASGPRPQVGEISQ
jgi:hypothetical protein